VNWQDTCILHAGQYADHAEETVESFDMFFKLLIYMYFIFFSGLAWALQQVGYRVK
jgi:hypothetical protein